MNEKEKLVLLEALGIDSRKLRCRSCRRSTNIKVCSILPPILIDKTVNATIICDDRNCFMAYVDEVKV